MHNPSPQTVSRTRKSSRPALPAESAGETALPPALHPPARGGAVAGGEVTRRVFLAAAGGAIALGALSGCASGHGHGSGGGVEIFALSGRGRRVSRAAKGNNANKRFLTSLAADDHRAHLGDTSYVVRLNVSRKEFDRLFGRGNVMADLRHV